MAKVLTAEAIEEALTSLDGWSGDAHAITRTVTAASFRQAVELVDAVAVAAEKVDHHPDIDIRYRTVTFRLCTHSADGVTALDIDLAERIDSLVAERVPAGEGPPAPASPVASG